MPTATAIADAVQQHGGNLETFWSAATAIATILMVIATVLLVLATMVLVVTAAVSAFFAYRLYRSGLDEKAVDRTITLLNGFTDRAGQPMSPLEAYQFLNTTHQGTDDKLKGLTTEDPLFVDTQNAYSILLNYFERVRLLNKQRLLNMELFYREQNLILQQSAFVMGYLRPWFERVTRVQYTTNAVDALVQHKNDFFQYGTRSIK